MVEDSIFDLAFVSLLDPVAMDQWQKDFPDTYLQRIDLDRVEATAVFQGMLICIMIQVVAVILLIMEFSEKLEFKNDRYLLLIPKLISCYYMHNILAGEIKDGMNIMKYTTNHPDYFERRALDFDASEATTKDDGKYTRITYGFLLGFIQWAIAFALEIMSIIFLNSLSSYRLIIVCYASLTAIANFDNMFARALDGHAIKAAAGQQLAVTFHRYMKREQEDLGGPGHHHISDEGMILQSLKPKKFPRQNCYLQFLRFIYKTIRVFHVSFFFYFAPFLMLFYQFFQYTDTKKAR